MLWKLKTALPKCKVGFRLVRDIDLSEPSRAARDFWTALAPKLAEFPFDFCSGANETGYHADDSVMYSEFNRQLAALVHAAYPAMIYGSFDFGVCWPDVALVADGDYDAGLVYGDFLAMHLYHLPDNEDANTIYHHRHVRAALPAGLKDKPIWATEFGLDWKGRAGDGWSGPTWGWSPDRYGEWLHTTAWELADVEHAIIYLSEETDPTWASWGVVGHNVIADWIAQANKREDKRKETPVAVYTFPQGFDSYAELNPGVGKPAGKPRYDDDGNLRQLTENGELIGLKEFGWKVNFFAAAPRKGTPIV